MLCEEGRSSRALQTSLTHEDSSCFDTDTQKTQTPTQNRDEADSGVCKTDWTAWSDTLDGCLYIHVLSAAKKVKTFSNIKCQLAVCGIKSASKVSC